MSPEEYLSISQMKKGGEGGHQQRGRQEQGQGGEGEKQHGGPPYNHLPTHGHKEAPPYLSRLLEVPNPDFSLRSFFKSFLPESPL